MPYPNPSHARMASVDILRGLTMVLMVFVNDLWSLKDIPNWLLHVPPGTDGIGLSDIVFPAFLFIVGLSLPLAIEARRKKGDDRLQILIHVVTRSFALIIMGVFLVNGENLNAEATGFSRHLWYFLSCLGFILVWNTYPKGMDRRLAYALQTLGIVMLLVLAYLYKGGKEGAVYAFKPHWWGILGLIGWSYLAAGIVTLMAKGRFSFLFAGWAFFAAVSMFHHAKWIPEVYYNLPEPIVGGTMTGLVLGGVLAMSFFLKYEKQADISGIYLVLLTATGILVFLSLITRPYWGLAKQEATPAWLFLCSAFTLGAFVIIHHLADRKGLGGWFAFAEPAGTDTLLCYLMPYFAYALKSWSGLKLPEAVLTGFPGLVKSLLFALLCVWLTRMLSNLGVKLKL
jgi:heparan-alpha-glucosaminide N-acetyltransferase